MSLFLHTIALGLGGSVRGDKVVATGPEVANQRVKWKRKRKSLTVWIGDDRDIRVHSHAGQDPITTKDCVRRQCGLPPWVPKQRKPKPLPPLWERIQFLAESLKIARGRARITFEQYALIINDLKNASLGANLKSRAPLYAREFGFTPAETMPLCAKSGAPTRRPSARTLLRLRMTNIAVWAFDAQVASSSIPPTSVPHQALNAKRRASPPPNEFQGAPISALPFAPQRRWGQ